MEKEEIKLFVDSKVLKENELLDAMDSIENAIQISEKIGTNGL
jgi:hypothetical protein